MYAYMHMCVCGVWGVCVCVCGGVYVCVEMGTGKFLWTEYYGLRRRQMAVEWLHMAWDGDKGLYVDARYESFGWHKIRGISSLTEEFNVGICSMMLGN